MDFNFEQKRKDNVVLTKEDTNRLLRLRVALENTAEEINTEYLIELDEDKFNESNYTISFYWVEDSKAIHNVQVSIPKNKAEELINSIDMQQVFSKDITAFNEFSYIDFRTIDIVGTVKIFKDVRAQGLRITKKYESNDNSSKSVSIHYQLESPLLTTDDVANLSNFIKTRPIVGFRVSTNNETFEIHRSSSRSIESTLIRMPDSVIVVTFDSLLTDKAQNLLRSNTEAILHQTEGEGIDLKVVFKNLVKVLIEQNTLDILSFKQKHDHGSVDYSIQNDKEVYFLKEKKIMHGIKVTDQKELVLPDNSIQIVTGTKFYEVNPRDRNGILGTIAQGKSIPETLYLVSVGSGLNTNGSIEQDSKVLYHPSGEVDSINKIIKDTEGTRFQIEYTVERLPEGIHTIVTKSFRPSPGLITVECLLPKNTDLTDPFDILERLKYMFIDRGLSFDSDVNRNMLPTIFAYGEGYNQDSSFSSFRVRIEEEKLILFIEIKLGEITKTLDIEFDKFDQTTILDLITIAQQQDTSIDYAHLPGVSSIRTTLSKQNKEMYNVREKYDSTVIPENLILERYQLKRNVAPGSEYQPYQIDEKSVSWKDERAAIKVENKTVTMQDDATTEFDLGQINPVLEVRKDGKVYEFEIDQQGTTYEYKVSTRNINTPKAGTLVAAGMESDDSDEETLFSGNISLEDVPDDVIDILNEQRGELQYWYGMSVAGHVVHPRNATPEDLGYKNPEPFTYEELELIFEFITQHPYYNLD